MYEKRRDWEKLLGLQRREAERLPPGAERAAKFLEIAKLATERVKKPEVCIELWKRSSRTTTRTPRRSARSPVSTSARKDFDKLADVLEKQAEITLRRAGEDPDPHQARDDLRRPPEQRRGRGRRVAHAPRARPERSQARRRRSRRSTSRSAAGTTSRSSTPRAASGTSSSASSSSKRRRRPNPRRRSALLFKIAELWADKKQKPDRAAKAYEKVLELEPKNLQAAEALIPIYTAANNAKALANAIEVKLGHEQDADDEARALLARSPASTRARSRTRRRRSSATSSAFELAPGDEQYERGRRARRQGDAAVGRRHRGVPRGHRRRRRRAAIATLGVMLRLRLGRVLVDEVQRIDEALAAYRAVYEADGENAEALAALEQLYRQTSRFDDLLGIYEKKRDLVDRPRREEGRSTTRSPSSTRPRSRTSTRRSTTYVAGARRRADRRAGARRARRPLRPASSAGSRTSTSCAGASSSTSTRRSSSTSSSASAQTLEKHLGDAAGALENYREILFLDAQHEGARAALEAMLENAELARRGGGDPRGDLRGARRLAEAHPRARDPQRAARTTSQKRVALKRKVARISAERARATTTRAFDALASALKDDPALAETRDEIEQHRRGARTRRSELVALYGEIAEGLTDARSRATTGCASPRIDERLGDVDEAAQAYDAGPRARPGGRRGARRARAALHAHRSAGAISSASSSGASSRRTTPSEREALYAPMAQIYDERLGRPEDAVAAYRRSSSSTRRAHARSRALDALFTRQKMWSELAENLEAQLALADDDEAQLALMLRLAALRETRDGPGRRRDRGLPPGPRARRRRTPQALAALERLGTDAEHELAIADLLEPLYRHARRLRRSSSASTRCRSAAATTPTRRVELLHQIAQLYEDAAGDLELRVRHARARPQGGPGERGDAAAARSRRPRDRAASPISRSVFEELAGADRGPDARERALHDERARLRDRPRRRRHAPSRSTARSSRSTRSNLAAAESLERLFRSAERYQELSLILQRKAEILEEPHEQEGRALPGGGHRGGRPRAARGGHRRLQQGPRDRRRRPPRASTRSSSATSTSRAGRTCSPSTRRRPISSPTPTRRRRIYYQVGAVYERELGDVPQRDRHVPRSPRARPRRPAGALAPRRPLRAGAELAGAPLASSRARAR